MGKGIFLSVSSWLALAGMVYAQAPESPPAAPAEGAARALELPPVAPVEGAAPPCNTFAESLLPTIFPGARPGRATASLEYLLWFRKSRDIRRPEFFTTQVGAPSPTDMATPSMEKNRLRTGIRATVGYWFPECDTDPVLEALGVDLKSSSVEFSGFVLGKRTQTVEDNRSPVLLRPFFDLNDRFPNAVVVAAPGLGTGTIALASKNDVWGLEADYRRNICSNPPGSDFRVDILGGFRYLNVDTNLRINRQTAYNPTINPLFFPAFVQFAGNRIHEAESFDTNNDFYGAELGLTVRWYPCKNVEVTSDVKLALGAVVQEIDIEGAQLRTFPDGQTVASRGALLALPSNIGHHERTRFGQVPEVNFNVRVPVNDYLTFFGGYSWIFVHSVVQAGRQIDPVIDITQIPIFPGAATAFPTGQARPQVPFRDNNFWMQGLNIGAEIAW
jgi:hypothetical protein